MNKILTVSIAAYNVAKTIKETLDSFISFDEIEVLIVNDGSIDETKEIVLEYINNYPHIFRLINKENGGWGSTINRSIKEAKGLYFSLCDGDDHYNIEHLKDFLSYLKKEISDIVYAPFKKYDEETLKEIAIMDLKPNDKEYFMKYDLLDINSFSPYMHNSFVKTILIKDLNISENCFYTDNEYAIKILKNVNNLSYYDKYIYEYRLNNNNQSVSLEGLEKHYLDQEKVLFNLIDFRKQNTNSKIDMIIKNMLHDLTIWMYLIYLKISINAKHKADLRAFDKKLKEEKELYYMKDIPKHIKILRMTNFIGYNVIVRSKA